MNENVKERKVLMKFDGGRKVYDEAILEGIRTNNLRNFKENSFEIFSINNSCKI